MGTACCPHRVYAVPLVSVGMGVLLAIGEDAGMGRRQRIYGMYLFHVLCHAFFHAPCLILHGFQFPTVRCWRWRWFTQMCHLLSSSCCCTAVGGRVSPSATVLRLEAFFCRVLTDTAMSRGSVVLPFRRCGCTSHSRLLSP